ncbi:response regulator [Bradyrhizobium diazoefficiens]|jgi:two-component system, LuxR family, response regulator FixJ|uniref:response regulator transcription factor n=1 Tax=Bradyrhizobium tunisiense TaxID=3278709 RepID=UPI001BAAED5D|nr:response regulator [Bradyrhizobium diazoefficiens]MBR0811187.1 response regulator [Bradyrhizobium diazoefficiens]
MIEVGSHHERPSSSARRTVYVVDDDAAVLGSLRFLLETDGFAVRTFRSGTALLNVSGAPGPDCYVIDYKMPGLNGIELAGQLRESDRDAPVILITGYPDENISARAATAGIKDVVLKPLLDENLVKCIRHAIQDRARA